MVELLTVYGILVIVILITCIPQLVKFITWCHKIYKQHKTNTEQTFEAGRQAQIQDDATEQRFEAGEKQIKELTTKEDKLEQILLKQQEQLNYLLEYNKNAIRAQVYKMWKKVKAQKPIDIQEYELLEESFELYEATGGNGKTKARMEEIREHAIFSLVKGE